MRFYSEDTANLPPHDIAEICMNGHLTTAWSERRPQFREKYCSQCGSETIRKYPSCDQPIRGGSNQSTSNYEVPPFCIHCGKPFPWTEAQLQAATELLDLSELDAPEREAFSQSLRDAMTDNPRTKLAATKITMMLKKAGPVAKDGLIDIAKQLVVESAKGYLRSHGIPV